MSAIEVLAVNVPEAARRLGVSPRTVAALIASKELPSRKIGRRRLIPVRSLEDFLRRDHPTCNGKAVTGERR
jgi:excisionase family DNA binding protein